MSVLLAPIFLGIAIAFGYWFERRRARVPREEVLKGKLSLLVGQFFVHPGHAWVEVVEPGLVAVGTDEFTRSVFGSVEELTLPEPGKVIQQGGKGWILKRGDRQLDQTSPITRRVVEVNQDVAQNPRLPPSGRKKTSHLAGKSIYYLKGGVRTRTGLFRANSEHSKRLRCLWD